MSIEAAMESIRGVGAPVGEGQLLRAAEVGETVKRELADPSALTDISRRLIAVADRLGCKRVFGASPLGERLAGAVVALANNGIKEHSAGVDGQHVLVVDGLLVTGVQIAAAVRRARAEGAPKVSAAVFASLMQDSEGIADDLVVLQPQDLRPEIRTVPMALA